MTDMQCTLAWLLPALLICLPTPAQEKEPERIPLKIGKDTTFFTGPVNDDGVIDYVEAVNKHFGKRIGRDSNAYALLVQLHPEKTANTSESQIRYRDGVFKSLKIELDRSMPSLTTRLQYAAEAGLDNADFESMVNKATSAPWSGQELFHVKAWIDANAEVLEKIDDALNRPQYFVPLVRTDGDESLSATLLPQLGFMREASRLIAARGLQAFNRGDLEAALEDAIRLQNFGKLVSNEPTLIGVLVGISIQNMRHKIVEAVIQSGELPHPQAIHFIETIRMFGPVDAIGSAIQYTERAMTLDTIQRAWAGSRTGLKFFIGQGGDRAASRMETVIRSQFFDINRSLKMVNQRYDKLVAIASIEDIKHRQKAYDSYQEKTDVPDGVNRITSLFSISALDTMPADWTKERYTDTATEIYILLLMADAQSAQRTQQRSQARQLVQASAIALLGYRDQHGELPDSLDALVPTYFDKVPIDFATGKPLVYRANDDGSALVYSLGHNLKDDGGVDDYNDGDIAIRIGTGKP